MSNYNLIFNVVRTRYVSYQFVEFVTTWLRYRKATCNDVLWNPRSLCKTPFDQVLDNLKEYSVMLHNKELKDAYQSLQCAVRGVLTILEVNYIFYKSYQYLVTFIFFLFLNFYIFILAVTIPMNNNNCIDYITLYHSIISLYKEEVIKSLHIFYERF